MQDVVIKGRTVEHLVTLLFLAAIITIINVFVFKYTGWLCDCSQNETMYQKPAIVEEKETPLILQEPEEETIVIPEQVKVKAPPKKEEPIKVPVVEPKKEEPKIETPKDKNATTMSEGEFALTIDHIEYRNVNAGLNDSDFVSLLNVTLTLDNNKLDFVPFVTFYLYDDNHRDYKNSNGESVQLDQIKKGNKRTDIAILKSLSLVDTDVEKTLRVRISNYADDSIIKNEEQTFTP